MKLSSLIYENKQSRSVRMLLAIQEYLKFKLFYCIFQGKVTK